jgi:hypothetical protein
MAGGALAQGAIKIKKSHKGELHKALRVPEGQPIPASKLAAAVHSSNVNLREKAQFAQNAKSFKH